MNYATLVASKATLGSIANWVNWSDAKLPVEEILRSAQSFIYDNMRVTDMKEIRTVSLAQDAASVARPGDLLSIIDLQDQYMQPISSVDLKSLVNRRVKDAAGDITRSSIPFAYALTKSTIEFDFAAAQDIDLTLTGYFRAAWLGSGTGGTVATNFLTDTYPHVLRPACLMFAADFLNDDAKYQRYATQFAAMLGQAMQSEEMNQMGMQVDVTYREQL